MSERFWIALSPPATPTELDTGLRFTDILFGFVISELFVRLQGASELPRHVVWHLVVGTALVLGSWIGFRRSLYRSAYEVKFINYPLVRFLLDQVMIIWYFRVAVLTSVEDPTAMSAPVLAETTISLLVHIFVLYAIWDVLGIAMVTAKKWGVRGPAEPKYPELKKKDDGTVTKEWQRPNVWGLIVTAGSLLLLGILWQVAQEVDSESSSTRVLFVACAILVAYRVGKEIRTSWQSL